MSPPCPRLGLLVGAGLLTLLSQDAPGGDPPALAEALRGPLARAAHEAAEMPDPRARGMSLRAIGLARHRIGDLEGAAKSLGRALDATGEFEEEGRFVYLLGVGRALGQAGDVRATEVIRQAMELAARSAVSFRRQAGLRFGAVELHRAGQQAEAREAFRAAVELVKADPESTAIKALRLRFIVESLYEVGERDAARETLDLAERLAAGVEHDFEASTAWSSILEASIAGGDVERTAERFGRPGVLDRLDARGRKEIAEALAKALRRDRAAWDELAGSLRSLMVEATATIPVFKDGGLGGHAGAETQTVRCLDLEAIAGLDIARGRIDDALELARTRLREESVVISPDSFASLARKVAEAGRREEALGLLHEEVERFRGVEPPEAGADALRSLALAQAEIGDVDAALGNFKLAEGLLRAPDLSHYPEEHREAVRAAFETRYALQSAAVLSASAESVARLGRLSEAEDLILRAKEQLRATRVAKPPIFIAPVGTDGLALASGFDLEPAPWPTAEESAQRLIRAQVHAGNLDGARATCEEFRDLAKPNLLGEPSELSLLEALPPLLREWLAADNLDGVMNLGETLGWDAVDWDQLGDHAEKLARLGDEPALALLRRAATIDDPGPRHAILVSLALGLAARDEAKAESDKK